VGTGRENNVEIFNVEIFNVEIFNVEIFNVEIFNVESIFGFDVDVIEHG